MRQAYTTWLPPVSVSVLLHLIVALVFIQQPRTAPTRVESIQVDMQTMASTPATPPPSKVQPRSEPKTEPMKQPEPAPVVVPETPQNQPATASSTPASAAPIPVALNFQPISKLTKPPSFLIKIDPVYPASEQRSGGQASVLAEISLDASGNLVNVTILKSAGTYFDQAVIESIRKSRFSPGYIETEAVPVKVLVPFKFKLR